MKLLFLDTYITAMHKTLGMYALKQFLQKEYFQNTVKPTKYYKSHHWYSRLKIGKCNFLNLSKMVILNSLITDTKVTVPVSMWS